MSPVGGALVISAWKQQVPAHSKLLKTSRFGPNFYRGIAVGAPGDASEAILALTDERHGNSILKNEQHLFTLGEKGKMSSKNLQEASGKEVQLCVLLR